MELLEQLTAHKERVLRMKNNILTEEATKTALIMPFIQMLGYDVFNPVEVIPEFTADISTRRAEKVDYCIQKDNEPIIIIECKHWKDDLTLHNTQLERYFNFTKAKFGILTNGIRYYIYTDLEEINKLDSKPFLEIDFENLKDSSINELKKFHKKVFDVNKITDSASELKYTNLIKAIYERELQNPSETFVKYFAKQAYSGVLTSKVVEQFTKIVKNSLNQKIHEIINERLKSALNKEKEQQTTSLNESDDDKATNEKIVFQDVEKGIVTTQEEIDAYEIILDILKGHVPPEKIAHRDTKSYMGILYEDNNRQPICRFWFNRTVKQLSIIGEDKKEEKYDIGKIEHIYKYSDILIKTALLYHVPAPKEVKDDK